MSSLTLVIEDDVLARARLRAQQEGTSVEAVVRQMIVDYSQGREAHDTGVQQPVQHARQSRAASGPEGRTWGRDAGMMLADLGARVIKVEAPGSGDETRSWGPPFVLGSDGQDVATYFLSCNRNKESIALDLKSEDGRSVLEALVRRADVLLENFRPGVLDRLAFAADRLMELNPGLVVLSISGFGHDGPEGGRPGYDQIAQGEAGLMSMTGSGPDDPQRVGVPIGDLLSGMYGASGVLAALMERERTGMGQVVRTSLLASFVGVHAFQGARWTVAGEVPRAQGNHHPSICPYGFSGVRTVRYRSRAGTRRCGSGCAPSSGWTHTGLGWRRTPNEWRTAARSSRCWRMGSPT